MSTYCLHINMEHNYGKRKYHMKVLNTWKFLYKIENNIGAVKYCIKRKIIINLSKNIICSNNILKGFKNCDCKSTIVNQQIARVEY